MTEETRGSNGGKKRAEKLSKQQRSSIAREAAKKRWSKDKGQAKPETGATVTATIIGDVTPVNIVSDEVYTSSPTITPIAEPPEEKEPKHCPACLAGESLEEGEGTHILATVEHPVRALNHFPSVIELPKQPESPIPLQTTRKRQAKPMPKAFKGASSYAEKRLAEALKERAEYMGRVAALNAEIPSLVSVIVALGGTVDPQAGQMQTYQAPNGAYQPNGAQAPQYPPNFSFPPAQPAIPNEPGGIDPALYQANNVPIPKFGPSVQQAEMVPGTPTGGTEELPWVTR
jgi:hypothetical protein